MTTPLFAAVVCMHNLCILSASGCMNIIGSMLLMLIPILGYSKTGLRPETIPQNNGKILDHAKASEEI
jgi:hypothetical protein